ncbi:MAG: TPM domain-containing protein [Ruminococcus sp.]|nr:TPM domain-containing protein [Ruminococcus sp.]
MIKKILLLTLSLVIIFTACISASADTEQIYDFDYALEGYDLTSLQNKLDSISEKYDCEIVLFTTEYLAQDAEDEAEYCLNEHLNYIGADSDSSSICLLVCMSERKYGIYCKGEAYTDIFKDKDLDDIEDTIKSYLSDGDVYGAFDAFADKCEDVLESYGKVQVKAGWIFISLGVGIIIAFIVVLIMKAQLKSVRFQPKANNYLKNGSLNVTQARDIFLYSTIVRTEKPKSNSSSSGSSSSGGGRSGSF